ncbi:MAG: radical SAM/SPASM domain-containing protein [Burkholderiales bacterium]|nr:radical SAM/SPASM domain-containing protein [Burkholderiales bacterium]
MESIYYVMAWACHRRCKHCYEDRFRPYVRKALDDVVGQAVRNAARIVDHFPERMTYIDLAEGPGQHSEKVGRIILSGGEALLDGVREAVTYPVIERLQARYRAVGGVNIIVQTTGDLLDDRIVGELLERGVYMISVASVDDFHVGMEGPEKQRAFVDRLTTQFQCHGMRASGVSAATRNGDEEAGPLFGFFGATPDNWIGKLWPRGRAWANSLPRGSIADNCNRWSGGLNFLHHRYNGSEVSVEPDGSVYPCCVKTALPLGNLTEEPLLEILDSLVGVPAYEAINLGQPQIMGLSEGWDEARFIEASSTTLPDGRPYENLCIGCDRFHREHLGPLLAAAKAKRLAERQRAARASAEHHLA